MNIYSHYYTLLKRHINLYLQTYKYLLFIILLSHLPLFPPNNFSCLFSIFKTKLHCHGHGVPRITHTFVSVCMSLIIDTKFVCVDVDVAPSPDVYRYFLAKFPETLGTRKYIAVWRACHRRTKITILVGKKQKIVGLFLSCMLPW